MRGSKLSAWLRERAKEFLATRPLIVKHPGGKCGKASRGFIKAYKHAPGNVLLTEKSYFCGYHYAVLAEDEDGQLLVLDMTARQFDTSKPKIYVSRVDSYWLWIQRIYRGDET